MNTQEGLPPQYIQNYQAFIDDIRAVHADLPLGVQADIGSGLWTKKDRNWYETFGQVALAMGFATWTAYESHIGAYMYEEAPQPISVTHLKHNEVVISFQKRIDPASAKLPGSLKIIKDNVEYTIPSEHIGVYGNRLIIISSLLPKKEFQLQINHITDTPSYWLYNKTQPANMMQDTTITIPKKNH